MRRLVLTAVTVWLCLAAPAGAGHSVLDLVSTGPHAQPCPPGVTCHAFFVGASADGTHALIRTPQPLVPQDSNATDDLYEWHSGNVRRVGLGATTGSVSEDGSRILFETFSPLLPQDADGSYTDVYELAGSDLRLISAPAGGSSAPVHARAIEHSADNSHIFFYTDEALDVADTDTTRDIYERVGSATRMVSVGLEIVDPDYADQTHAYEGSSVDGTRVFFGTNARMTPDDPDFLYDYYARADGQTRLVTTGPQPQPTPGVYFDSTGCCARSDDGTRVAFTTQKSLTPSDGDAPAGCFEPNVEEYQPCSDVYLRSAGATTHVTAGGLSCGDPWLGCWAVLHGISDDGSRIIFGTAESFVPQDTAGSDVYEWHDGVITLVSTGPLRNASDSPSQFLDVLVSEDARHVFFETSSALTSDDTDMSWDTYERFNGTTRLLTHQLPGGDLCCRNPFVGAAGDGSSVFIQTNDRLVGEDTDSADDLYELNTSGATLLANGHSVTPTTGPRIAAGPGRISSDGGRVFLDTTLPLSEGDTDGTRDIYLQRRPTTTGYIRPRSAASIDVALVPAEKPCLAPNREHGPPLAYGSCNPPEPESPNLTLGTGGVGKSSGRVRLDVMGAPGGPDDADMRMSVVLTNVMELPSLADYTGELHAGANVRLTDRVAGVPSTTDLSLGFTVPCDTTADTTLGGECRLLTTLDALIPGAVPEGTRAVWGLDQFKVHDAGPDGDVNTTGDNSMLAVQGIFVP